MNLKCVVAFGNFVPGDEVDVPDGAIFDHAYFEEVSTTKDDTAKDEAQMETDGAPAKTLKGGDK